MTDFDERTGELLQKVRTKRGMTQADLAQAMTALGHPMHQQTILKIEKGSRPLKFAEALALSEVLELDLEEFRAPEPIESTLGKWYEDLDDLGGELKVLLAEYRQRWNMTQALFRQVSEAGVDLEALHFGAEAEGLLSEDGFAKSVISMLRRTEDDFERQRAATPSGPALDAWIKAQEERQAELEELLEVWRGEHQEEA